MGSSHDTWLSSSYTALYVQEHFSDYYPCIDAAYNIFASSTLRYVSLSSYYFSVPFWFRAMIPVIHLYIDRNISTLPSMHKFDKYFLLHSLEHISQSLYGLQYLYLPIAYTLTRAFQHDHRYDRQAPVRHALVSFNNICFS